MRGESEGETETTVVLTQEVTREILPGEYRCEAAKKEHGMVARGRTARCEIGKPSSGSSEEEEKARPPFSGDTKPTGGRG
jgi:hypothetical protein